jgi:predicted esterase
VRHLVHHSSGIRDLLQLQAVGDLPDDMSLEEILALLARQRALNFPPGEQILYSNGGYALLELIIERATGLSVDDYLRAEFFGPLGMGHTQHGEEEDGVHGRAAGYRLAEGKYSEVIRAGGMTGILTNSGDMARWISALESDRMGPPGFREAMLQRGVLSTGDSTYYAFGLDRMVYRGVPVIRHGGAGSGFRAGMAIYPDEDLALFAMCNLGNLDAVERLWQVAEILLEGRLEPEEPQPSTPYSMMHPPPPGEPPVLTPGELAEFAGRYHGPELGVDFLVRVEEEGLRVGPEDWMRPMLPLAEDLFGQGPGWAEVSFDRDEKRRVTGFIMNIGRVSGLVFERVDGGGSIREGEPLPPQGSIDEGFLDRDITSHGSSTAYQVFVPREYDPARSWPLIVYLHGLGGGGTDGTRQTQGGLGNAVKQHPEWFPAVALFPQAPPDSNWVGSVAQLVFRQIEATAAEFNVDPDRVYLTGASMGGEGVYHLALLEPGRFAALVVSCGSPFTPDWRRRQLGKPPQERSEAAFDQVAESLRHLPLWAFHGRDDDVVDVADARAMVEALEAAGGGARLTEYAEQGHEACGRAFLEPEVWPWMFAQKRPGR